MYCRFTMKERRRDRLASFVREELPEFLRVEGDLPNGVVVSILHVEVIASASRANIFVSIFPDEQREEVAKVLKMRENEATHFLRGRLKSKHVPVIRFHVR